MCVGSLYPWKIPTSSYKIDRCSYSGFKSWTNHYSPTPTHLIPYLKADMLTFSFPESLKIQFKNVFSKRKNIPIDSNLYKSIGAKCQNNMLTTKEDRLRRLGSFDHLIITLSDFFKYYILARLCAGLTFGGLVFRPFSCLIFFL